VAETSGAGSVPLAVARKKFDGWELYACRQALHNATQSPAVMTVDVNALRRDMEQLMALVIEMNKRIGFLEEELRLARSWRYGRTTDAIEDQKQAKQFNEAKDRAAEVFETEAAEQTVTATDHDRKKTGRRSLPANLPCVEIVHDISEPRRSAARSESLRAWVWSCRGPRCEAGPWRSQICLRRLWS
jgi:hypothetical protein